MAVQRVARRDRAPPTQTQATTRAQAMERPLLQAHRLDKLANPGQWERTPTKVRRIPWRIQETRCPETEVLQRAIPARPEILEAQELPHRQTTVTHSNFVTRLSGFKFGASHFAEPLFILAARVARLNRVRTDMRLPRWQTQGAGYVSWRTETC